jgi:hypothetical protein
MACTRYSSAQDIAIGAKRVIVVVFRLKQLS